MIQFVAQRKKGRNGKVTGDHRISPRPCHLRPPVSLSQPSQAVTRLNQLRRGEKRAAGPEQLVQDLEHDERNSHLSDGGSERSRVGVAQ